MLTPDRVAQAAALQSKDLKSKTPRGNSPKVVLVNMGNIPECRELALALQEAGLLECWYNGLYHRPGAESLFSRLLPALNRRIHPDIDVSKVRILLPWELLRLACLRLPFIPSRLIGLIERYFVRAFTRSAGAHLAKHTPDVVIGVNYSSLEVFEEAKRVGALAIMSYRSLHPAVEYELITAELRRRGTVQHDFFRTSYRRTVERRIQEIDLADYVLCPSQSVVDSMRASGVSDAKLILVPFGADVRRFRGLRRHQPDGKFRVLFVGKVGLAKGLYYLIDAFKQLRLPDSELILVGGLDESARALPEFGDSIVHIDWIPPLELNKYYLFADLFVLPSLSEGSALVSYEAMAAGLPIIATSVSGTLVRDGQDGFLVAPSDSQALQERILYLYQNPDARHKMGKSAKARVLEFSWRNYRSHVAKTIYDLWQREHGSKELFDLETLSS